MASFSGLGIGLSFLFGCILLGLVAELFYLLWWKKRITSRGIEPHYSNYAKELSYMFCWKKPASVDGSKTQQATNLGTNPDAINGHEPDLELGSDKDLLKKGFDEEESVESELMRLHNLCGPPRFLFTINEETKDDLESEDGKSRGDRSRKGSRTRSLSDLLAAIETPILTPLASPTLKANTSESYIHRGFNPLFESLSEAELNRLRSSPPPKFKFLRDAEEKLMRKLVEEAEKRALKHGGSIQDSVAKAPPSSMVSTEEKNCPFVAIAASKSKEKEAHQPVPQYHSTASQVLPLASSPLTFKSLDDNNPIRQ